VVWYATCLLVVALIMDRGAEIKPVKLVRLVRHAALSANWVSPIQQL